MKRPQWITLAVAIALVAILYLFGRTVPEKKPGSTTQSDVSGDIIPTDTILAQAKKKLSTDQVTRLNALEHSVVRGDVKDQQLKVYHQLAHFWADTGQLFEPYAWYEAEAARLENSEKSLTFAAHLFLQNLRGENDPALRTWKAVQAKDLFERSLKINPNNDSSTVGLGACYIFGGINATPMEGIMKVRSVAEKDSTNIFAQEVLAQASMLSAQYDKAIDRFKTVYRLSINNIDAKLESALMLAEAYEKKADKTAARDWYEKSLLLIKNEEVKTEVKKRIDELKK
ncbi:MAG: tetratricopeptide repeat protein [Chitinophagales bacterium]